MRGGEQPLRVEQREDYCLVQPSGVLDGHGEEDTAFIELLGQDERDLTEHHVLDLSDVEYMNSTMLGQVVRFHGALQARDFRLVLLGAHGTVRRVLQETGIDRLVPLVDSKDEVPEALDLKRRQAVRHRPQNLDYDKVAEEIEEIILGGDEAAERLRQQGGELDKLLMQEPEAP